MVHELFHGVTGISDAVNGAMVQGEPGFKGPAVDFENKIRSERGLPQRESYYAEPGSRGTVKIHFDHVNPDKPKKVFNVVLDRKNAGL